MRVGRKWTLAVSRGPNPDVGGRRSLPRLWGGGAFPPFQLLVALGVPWPGACPSGLCSVLMRLLAYEASSLLSDKDTLSGLGAHPNLACYLLRPCRNRKDPISKYARFLRLQGACISGSLFSPTGHLWSVSRAPLRLPSHPRPPTRSAEVNEGTAPG